MLSCRSRGRPGTSSMSPYTDERIARLAAGLESDRVERRRSVDDGKAIRRNICAFANDLPGHGETGILLIGVEDDGRVSDTPVDDELLDRLTAARDHGDIMPMPSLVVEKRRLDGGEVAVVFVEPAWYPPVRYCGRAWVRVGATVRPATAYEEACLTERRRAGDLPCDMRPCESASLSDLDEGALRQQYLPAAVAPEVLEADRRPLATQLRSLRLLEAKTSSPVWGALLAFARDPLEWLPGAYVQFLRIAGREVTDPILDRKRLTGRVADVLRGLEELLGLAIRTRTRFADVERELRQPDYPAGALRQLVRNAVMHRRYETNAPIRVYWYDDRVEITSPGGLFGRVREDDFGEGVTDYRNPLVAEIMSRLGFVQRFGVGIPLARKALEANGNPPPEFSFSHNRVTVVVKAAP